MALDEKYVEKMIIKAAFEDGNFVATTSSVLEKKIFSNSFAGDIYEKVKKHYSDYSCLPTPEMISNSFSSKETNDIAVYIMDALKVEVDVIKQSEFVLDSTDDWLKERAMKKAVMDAADIITGTSEGDYAMIKVLVEEALLKTLKVNLGLNYFGTLSERLTGIFTATEKRVPTYYPTLDEYLSGGFPANTLSIAVGKIHKGKSNLMLNFAARQIMHGHNVAIFTLEMSEHAVAQRMDAMLTNMDINAMYERLRTPFLKEILSIKASDRRGDLRIKQFPPHSASVNEFRAYLHTLSLHRFKPDILYCDYVNLMKPCVKGGKNANLYEDVKRISEELRALSFEYGIPIVSVSQFNRAGMMESLETLDYAHVSESVSLAATADFMMFLGTSDDLQTYQSEMHYKIIKNRLGGGLMSINKFFMDDRSLRLYDEMELDRWIEDAAISNGNREIAAREQDETVTRRRGGNNANGRT